MHGGRWVYSWSASPQVLTKTHHSECKHRDADPTQGHRATVSENLGRMKRVIVSHKFRGAATFTLSIQWNQHEKRVSSKDLLQHRSCVDFVVLGCVTYDLSLCTIYLFV